MLTSRKALFSNLNYVHLQQVSLSLQPKVSAPLLHGGPVLNHVTGCHQWKDSSDVMVDANSNDPSVPCQCCEQNSGHKEALCYSSDENLEAILCEEYLSPDELPLSPLSPSSPSTDSSSSSDFTLDDSPVSMYYREYAQEELSSPDQQPDIIPLDVEDRGSDTSPEDFMGPDLNDSINSSQEDSIAPDLKDSIASSQEDSGAPNMKNPISSSQEDSVATASEDTMGHDLQSTIVSSAKAVSGILVMPDAEPENRINNNIELDDVPFIDWSSDTQLDSNCNALIGTQPLISPSSASMLIGRNQSDGVQWSQASMKINKGTDANQSEALMNITDPNQLKGDQWSQASTLINQTMDPNHSRGDQWYQASTMINQTLDQSDDTKWPQPPIEINRGTGPNPSDGTQWNRGEELIPGLRDSFNQSPKKTITSFHELAQKRRKSGGQLPSPLKKDKSDWLIVFSPDVEHPPVNELTASAFYHVASLPEGKEVTTFRELRFRNTMNKQGSHQAKCNKGPLVSADGAQNSTDGQQMLEVLQDTNIFQCMKTEKSNDQAKPLQVFKSGPLPTTAPQRPASTNPPIPPPRRKSQRGLKPTSQVNIPMAMTKQTGEEHPCKVRKESPETEAGTRPQPIADGADRRNPEGVEAEPLMADGGEDGAHQGKKSLLIAVGSAVDKIITHFNGSRNQVQKAQLGDSRLNPSLGHLVAGCLCPALAALLGDGLKPFQKDVIVGRRRLGPWHLVEASAKTGPEPIRRLFSTVTQLQPLRDPQRRFNAFIFSLLNAKQLEAWLCHLHQRFDELSACFLPSGFLPLAVRPFPQLWAELLLTLQPLAALTFYIDLLFEHHHLSLQDPPTPQHPPPQSALPPADSWGVPAFQHILDLGGWLAHNLTSQSEGCTPGPQHDGQDSLSREAASPNTRPPIRDWSRTWWSQLTQASRMYLPNKSEPFPEPHPRGAEEEASHTAASLKTTKGGDPLAKKDIVPAPEEKAAWFGPLFGESRCRNQETEGEHTGKSRRPSSWLPPNMNVLDLMRKRPAPEGKREELATPQPKEEESESRVMRERRLRALCDHSASGAEQLSFKKGDTLLLLGTLDDDWVRCRHGDHSGLVPVAYTSLIL